jgi:hypothetical protein|tara:strand:- start:1212 stop:1580 length:369 start_codon:yes stop_codon:yes gene_type:complete
MRRARNDCFVQDHKNKMGGIILLPPNHYMASAFNGLNNLRLGNERPRQFSITSLEEDECTITTVGSKIMRVHLDGECMSVADVNFEGLNNGGRLTFIGYDMAWTVDFSHLQLNKIEKVLIGL